jgi:HEPN domain-containing protein
MRSARGHLKSAHNLLQGDEESRLDAGYLTSQAAEKAARAVVENAGFVLGTTHSFEQSANPLPADHPMRASILEINEMGLSAASTSYRYPNPSSGRMPKVPSLLVFQERLNRVEAFVASVRRHLGMKPETVVDLGKLAIGLRARALSRGWEVPGDFVEAILIYANDPKIMSAIIDDVKNASSLADLLQRHSISFPGLTDG